MHSHTHHSTGTQRQGGGCLPWSVAAVVVLALGFPLAIQAKTFHCDAGDVQCLIAAIQAANVNGKKNTIRLEAGTYTLTASDNNTDGPNGLPSVTSTLTIQGVQDAATVIANSGGGRLMHIAATGTLTLKGLTLQGGVTGGFPPFGGGGIFNKGTLTLLESTLAHNSVGNNLSAVADKGGGLYNDGGTVRITNSTLARNASIIELNPLGGGGLVNNSGTIEVQKPHSLQ